jgi:hypothetical protein
MSKCCLRFSPAPLEAALIDGVALPARADDLRYWALGLRMTFSGGMDTIPGGVNDKGHVVGWSDAPQGSAIGSYRRRQK